MLISGYKNKNVWANNRNEKNWKSNQQKPLVLDIDTNLNFNEHISSLCKTAGNNPSALARLLNFTSFKQRCIILKNFIESQFAYCSLLWMSHSRRLNTKINHLHERSLRIVYKVNYSSCVDLLAKNKSVNIRQKQTLSLLLSNYLKLKKVFTGNFRKRLHQYRTLWPKFTKLFLFKGFGYDSVRSKE